MSQREKTEEYIKGHIARVQAWLFHFAQALFERGSAHDASKLEEPEISGWTQMDLEPRYPYGSPEYEAKKARYNWLFKEHYSKNKHHPEYFEIHNNKATEMDLMDLLELLCDWLGYKKSIRYTEASALVDQQCERYGFSDEIHDLLLNTLKNYFVDFGGTAAAYSSPSETSELYNASGTYKADTNKKHFIDMTI